MLSPCRASRRWTATGSFRAAYPSRTASASASADCDGAVPRVASAKIAARRVRRPRLPRSGRAMFGPFLDDPVGTPVVGHHQVESLHRQLDQP